MDTIKDISIFKKDTFLLYVFNKIQALVNALYLITNLFPEKEPIRIAIREKGVDLIGEAVSGRTLSVNKIIEITALLEIAANTKLVSSMNLEILKTEFQKLVKEIEERIERTDIKLDPRLFKLNPPNDLPKPNSQVAVPKPEKQASSIVLEDRNLVSNADRQKTLLDIIRTKDSGHGVSINDIAERVPALGGKTLQRELQKMVSAGLLKREGERRWSRYSAL